MADHNVLLYRVKIETDTCYWHGNKMSVTHVTPELHSTPWPRGRYTLQWSFFLPCTPDWTCQIITKSFTSWIRCMPAKKSWKWTQDVGFVWDSVLVHCTPQQYELYAKYCFSIMYRMWRVSLDILYYAYIWLCVSQKDLCAHFPHPNYVTLLRFFL